MDNVKEYDEAVRSIIFEQIVELFNNPDYYTSDFLQEQATSLLLALHEINKLTKN